MNLGKSPTLPAILLKKEAMTKKANKGKISKANTSIRYKRKSPKGVSYNLIMATMEAMME